MEALAIHNLTSDNDLEIYVENSVSPRFSVFLNAMLVGAKLFLIQIL